jgi:uncharacterized protein
MLLIGGKWSKRQATWAERVRDNAVLEQRHALPSRSSVSWCAIRQQPLGRKQGMCKLRKFLLAMLMGLPLAGWAGIIDCKKTDLEPIEKTICTNSELSKLNEQMAQVYALKIKTTKNMSQLLDSKQSVWKFYGLDICDNNDIMCLRKAYQSRIMELNRYQSPFLDDDRCYNIKISGEKNSRCVGTLVYRNPVVPIIVFNKWLTDIVKPEYSRLTNADTPEFKQLLDDNGKIGQIISCERVIGVDILGTARFYGPGAIGGICKLQNGKETTEVKVCADYVAGHFAIVPIGNNSDPDKALFEFTSGLISGPNKTPGCYVSG